MKRKNKGYITELIIGISAIFFTFAFSSCTVNEQNKAPVNTATPAPEEKNIRNFESNDYVILVGIDKETSELNFQNIETGLRYTLKYNERTTFSSRKGQPLSKDQLFLGGIAKICFTVEDELLKSFSYSDEYFCISDVDHYEFLNNNTRFEYMNDRYEISEYPVLASGDKIIEMLEIDPSDKLSIYGKDNVIYSIVVEKGHGYLRLENDSYFIGGFIEVGEDIIVPITSQMVLTVPEGQYKVLVSNEGTIGEKYVTIGKNQDVTLDLGDIEVEERFGQILFVINAEDPSVYIDGEKESIEAPVKLSYGVHQIVVMADGYDTISKYISVGSESASVKLELPLLDEGNEPVATPTPHSTQTPTGYQGFITPVPMMTPVTVAAPNDDTAPTAVPTPEPIPEPDGTINTTSGDGNMYIDGPEGCEVYINGSYVGTAPICFKKKPGTQTVTLRKDGFVTKSYTINVENDEEDIHYSFSGLESIE